MFFSDGAIIDTSSEKRRLDSTREELREAGFPKQPSVWLRANSGRRSMIETMATAWPKSRSYRRVEFDHRTSWRSTWKPNSLHTMASDPPAMNHPSDVLTIRRFVSDCLGFLLLCAALVHGKRNALLGKSIKVSNLFNQVTTETTHCAYAA